jgi:hypothetical protein
LAPEDANKLLCRFEKGLWRVVSIEEGLLRLSEISELVLPPTADSGNSQQLVKRIDEVRNLVSRDHERYFREKSSQATRLVGQGEVDKGVDELRPYLCLGKDDPLLRAASEVAAWIYFRNMRYDAAKPFLQDCHPTEKVLYMTVVLGMASGDKAQAKEAYGRMKELYPSGELTGRVGRILENLSGLRVPRPQ